MESPQRNTNLMRVLGVLLLIAALILLSYWYKQSQQPKVFPKEMATAGQVIAGFPKALIFDASNVTESYSIDYNAKTKQYTTSYVSKNPYGLAYAKTIQYLKLNNYYISNQRIDKDKAVAYGVLDDKIINALITPIDKKTSTVVISYVTGFTK